MKSIRRVSKQQKDKLMEFIPTLYKIKKTYNEKENVFIYPDFNTRLIMLPARALLYLTVVGNYIWEYKVISYTGKPIMNGILQDIDYNFDNVSGIVYNILSKSIAIAESTINVEDRDDSLPEDMMKDLKDRLIGHLVSSAVEKSQLEIIEEEIEWLQELQLRKD